MQLPGRAAIWSISLKPRALVVAAQQALLYKAMSYV
jgi:hypothetical protein